MSDQDQSRPAKGPGEAQIQWRDENGRERIWAIFEYERAYDQIVAQQEAGKK